MIKVYQDLSLKNNRTGNCFNACVASILEIPLKEAAPHILPNIGATWWQEWAKWFKANGYKLEYHHEPPQGYSIASGRSSRIYPDWHAAAGERIHHACVAFDGVIVHDPFPIPGEFDQISTYQVLKKIN